MAWEIGDDANSSSVIVTCAFDTDIHSASLPVEGHT